MEQKEKLTYAQAGVSVKDNESWTGWLKSVIKVEGFSGSIPLPDFIIEKLLDIQQEKCVQIIQQEEAKQAYRKVGRILLKSYTTAGCTDGAGTKPEWGQVLGDLSTLGYDVLAMCVNDMVTTGVIPIAFLDYIGCSGIKNEAGEYVFKEYVLGLKEACDSINVKIIGGETAEMARVYGKKMDLVGFAIGVDIAELRPLRETIEAGDVIFALASGGMMANGYSMMPLLMEKMGIDHTYTHELFGGRTLGEMLLTPTRLFVSQALAANETGLVKSMAHITGGGLKENILRSLPQGLDIKLNEEAIPGHEIFEWILETGLVAREEMLKTFNMGYGFTFVADVRSWPVLESAVGERLFQIGTVVEA